jgi:hypothetical protein
MKRIYGFRGSKEKRRQSVSKLREHEILTDDAFRRQVNRNLDLIDGKISLGIPIGDDLLEFHRFTQRHGGV